MNRLAILIIVVFSIQYAVFAQDDLQTLVDQAAAAYKANNFGVASELYARLVDIGVKSGEVYFNLGNTYYQLQDLGRALLNYRRAEVYMPRDEDLRLNIMLISVQRVDGQVEESSIYWQIVYFTSDKLSREEFSWLLIFLWWICCGFGLACKFRTLNLNWLRWALAISVAIIALVGMLYTIRIYIESRHVPAVVVKDNVLVMTGPGTNYLELFSLHSAAEIRIIETRDNWVRFQLPDLREGWIEKKDLEVI